MSEIKAREITLVSVFELIHYDKNMNKHSDAQIKRLQELIKYQGFRTPLIVQKGTNVVVSGNGRLVAAKALGIQKVPVVYQEFENEAQLYAFCVSDNAIQEWSELDLVMINNEILNFDDFNIENLGLQNFNILEMASDDEIDDENLDEEKDKKFSLQVDLPNELEMRDLYDDLISKGYMVKEL